MKRHNRELMQVMRDSLAAVEKLPIELAVRELVAAAIRGHRIDPELHRVLAEQTPRTNRLEDTDILNPEAYALFTAFLEARGDELRVADTALAAFVCVTSIEALTHNAVLHHSASFTDETFEALADEATRMVVRYLR